MSENKLIIIKKIANTIFLWYNIEKIYLNWRTIASNNYIVTYSNNLNVGTASVTITFKGNYTGSIVKTFKINAKAILEHIKL